MIRKNQNVDGKSKNNWVIPKGTQSSFNGGCFLNDPKSKRQVIFSYLHYGGLDE